MQAFRIEAFQITPEANEIQGPDGLIRLNPKAMQVLLLLAEHPGEVVAKQELIDGVWEDMHVGDEVLTNAIYELRKALGDDARRPRFIQTVHRSGYRLLPAVQVEPTSPSAPAADESKPSEPLDVASRTHTLRWRRAVIVLATAATLATAGWFTAIRPWLCSRPTKVQVINRVQNQRSSEVESFLRFTLSRTGVFEVLDADQPVTENHLQIRLVAGPSDLLEVEIYQDASALFLGLEVDEEPMAKEILSRRIRELAATRCCLDDSEKASYLKSGAMSVEHWRRVREADRMRRQRRLTPAAEILSAVLKEDEDDVYTLERYAHLNQIRGLVAKAKEQTQRALDNAEKRGLGRRLLLERRQAELEGHPALSKRLLNECLKEGGDERARAGCLRKLAWHLSTYDRRCRLALGTYDEIAKDTERFRQEPDLYLFQAEFALACGDIEEARASIAHFERLEGQRSRADAYATWAWLELPTGRYEDVLQRLDFLKLEGDFRSRAMYFEAEVARRRLACDDAERLYLRLLASEHVSERRDALDGLFQLGYECDRPFASEAMVELEGKGADQPGPFYAPQAWAFLSLNSTHSGGHLEAMRSMTAAAHWVDPVVCSPHQEERPNRLHEEWFCLAEAAVATSEGRHEDALRMHQHIEHRLMPIDKALFRFHAGRAAEASGNPQQAEEFFCHALAWNPDHLQTLATLSDLLSRQQRHGEARVALERAQRVLASDSTAPLAKTLRAAHDALRTFEAAPTLCGRATDFAVVVQ